MKDLAPWMEKQIWDQVQSLVPIVCTDVLLGEFDEAGTLLRIGLIWRETPHQGNKWCTVGGRLHYGETIGSGIRRQLSETLGERLTVTSPVQDGRPLYVAQYAPSAASVRGFDAVDPRKHAIGLTYAVQVAGDIEPRNEALAFEWFKPERLPPAEEIGFDQQYVLNRCLKLLRSE
ncbi:DUF4916 domain-containing protein [Paenibacillus ehimensis]|uniref:DUF4916 domain-containing protein n=1 Tax=Paenibacillus ehimensis TaxID=79264 RepID=A0ABT8V2W3_9BACL|nr:DUF4916 domain-containing protein [Paenibacillus ehimensis]MDO3675761.1 DUF4916 domain-containing protein [Paenibacillus ehimensis]